MKAKEEMTFRKRMSFGEGSCRKFSLRTRKPHVKITRLTTYDVCIDTRWIRNYIQSLRELCARQIARISLLDLDRVHSTSQENQNKADVVQ